MIKELKKIYDEILKEGWIIVREKYKNKRYLVHACDEDGNTLLHYAVFEDNFDIIQQLVESGANPLITNRNGISPLVYAADSETNILEYLINQFMDSLTEYDQGCIFAQAAGLLWQEI